MATDPYLLNMEELEGLGDAIPAPEDSVLAPEDGGVTADPLADSSGGATLSGTDGVTDASAGSSLDGATTTDPLPPLDGGETETAAFYEAVDTGDGGLHEPFAADGGLTPWAAGGPADGSTATAHGMEGSNYIDSLLMGAKWDGAQGTGATITYSFGTSSSVYVSGYSEPTNAFGEFSAHQKSMTRQALDYFSSVADITFVEVTDSATEAGTLRFARSGDPPTAWAYGPGTSPVNGDVWVGWSSYYDDMSEGTYGFQTIMHEIGHALGLTHPHDGAVIGTSANDWLGVTIQSYKSYGGAGNGYTQDYYPTTPMYNDIAALQYIYGANTTHNATDTVYSWGAGDQLYETLWDAGGTDTIDWSNQSSGALINLNDGAWSELGPAFAINYSVWPWVMESRTLMIAENAVIENASGGSGDDTLIGNEFANQLTGGAGNDTLTGGLGNDTFVVGTGFGNDTITDFTAGVGSDDIIDLSAFGGLTFTDVLANTADVGGNAVITINGNTLTLTGIAKSDLAEDDFTGLSLGGIMGTAGNDILSGTSGAETIEGLAGNDFIFGGLGNDTLRGGDGADTLFGGGDSDTIFGGNAGDKLFGGAGNDVLTGDAGRDYLYGGAGDDNVSGGDDSDWLYGDDGADTLAGGLGNDFIDGGTGADAMAGGAGDDVYIVDNAGDTVTEAASSGTDTVRTTISHTLSAEVENLTLSGNAAIDGTGNNLNNIVFGNDAINTLSGAAGDDYLYGGIGNDTLNGGDGRDLLYGGADNDVISGGNGRDKLFGGFGADTLSGDADSDIIYAGDGDDSLSGGAARDYLYADAGADTLNGGLGADLMAGGAGQDTFVYADVAEGGDTIIDFSAGVGGDAVDISTLLGGLGYGGADPFADGYVRSVQSGTDTLVQIDSNGGGDAYVTLATLQGVTETDLSTDNWIV